MELRYIIMTILKILISVPTILLVTHAHPAALMGGHMDNTNATLEPPVGDYDMYEDIGSNESNATVSTNTEESSGTSEEIPDPSALVVPGYNLPENIFNKGKPFYLDRDPLTGAVDFDSKTLSKVDDQEYEYADDEPNVYDKANIDRRDSNVGSHRPSDVNQLVPNFHDFLNLPVKYNSDKHVYPLISSSYANTKVQGNVHKPHNHQKEHGVTTYRPTASPTYYLTTKPPAEDNKKMYTSTTTTVATTTKRSNQIHMFAEEVSSTRKPTDVYLTTENVNNIYLTTRTPSTTTKRVLSFFEQLFGDYDETEPTKPPTSSPPPQLFENLPSNKNKEVVQTPSAHTYPNIHAGPNIPMGANMAHETSYEYEEEYDDNVAVENKPAVVHVSPEPNHEVRVQTSTEVFEYVDEKETTTRSTSSSTTTPTTTTARSTTTTTTTPKTTTATQSTTVSSKITSLPLGENHVNYHYGTRSPVIVASQNLYEQLNQEKVVKPFNYNKPPVHQHVPSTSNIHIAHDQDTVSFVVGNHHNIESGKYVGSVTKETSAEGNNFKPFYNQETTHSKPQPASFAAGSSVTIQPLKNSEASLAIGVPVNAVQKVPGQVMDEKLELNEEKVDFPKTTGAKVVFPEEKPQPSYVADLMPPPKQQPNREILKLNSKPMFHQLPSDLTPPNELDVPNRLDRPRPPWDPRPGHFYSGRPEYARPPRPPPGDGAYKRIDSLPNILPQFRPNVKVAHRPYDHPNKGYARLPLLERPNNRPVGFFEKLQPPPPPKNLHNLRKLPPLIDQRMNSKPNSVEDVKPGKSSEEQFGFLQTPPKVVLANRRSDQDVPEVETLQMMQAKKDGNKEVSLSSEVDVREETEKPLYVVYPVNTPPLKMDVIDTDKKETVVIGTRAELPLPPSKINTDFTYEQDPLLHPKERNDAPILKPHSKPIFPMKSDFPYPLERPDPSLLNPAIPETPSNNGNFLDADTESRIINSKLNTQQISATLKTYTDKPIAIAYTPTPKPDAVNAEIAHGISNSEVTLGAMMHTRPQPEKIHPKPVYNAHRLEATSDASRIPAQEFQAPFQASMNIDSLSQGWSIIRDKNKEVDRMDEETTPAAVPTTSEFDIENFKPQLIGGFKPIYSYPEDVGGRKEGEVSERQE